MTSFVAVAVIALVVTMILGYADPSAPLAIATGPVLGLG
jgi:hypothetical protein